MALLLQSHYASKSRYFKNQRLRSKSEIARIVFRTVPAKTEMYVPIYPRGIHLYVDRAINSVFLKGPLTVLLPESIMKTCNVVLTFQSERNPMV